MRILFDHNTPSPLRFALKGHTVVEAYERGWDRISNGKLLEAAERAGFEVLVTADKSMRYEQNWTGRQIALVVLGSGQWPYVRLHKERVAEAVNRATPGSYTVVPIPIP